ncbi:MAG: OmpA family protein [Bacteroidales bacterium]|nr:OmpA family protein [Bacteroidales bacterium]MDD3892574.1 OmpA family protein [Bacteroidales bacterium]
MITYSKHIIAFVILLFSYHLSFSQFFKSSEVPVDIVVSFKNHSVQSAAKETFFNSLTVKNNINRSENLTLNITVPQGWNVIGSEKMELLLGPLDSVIIPVRIAVGSNVKGDIGYSVIASVSDNRGNTVKNEYCFVKIPRETDLNIRILDRLAYLDPISKSVQFSLRIANRGNRDEPITVLLDGNRRLVIGENRNDIISYDYVIAPYTDTTLTYRAELSDSEELGRNLYGLNASFTTIDTLLRSTLWFKKIESSIKNNISPSEKPLSIEIIGQGLLDVSQKPVVSLFVEGKTLFKNDTEIDYYYRNFRSSEMEDFYEYSRIKLGAKFKNLYVELGDNYKGYEAITRGRGGAITYQSSKTKTEFIANKNLRSDINNFGGQFSYDINTKLKFLTGAFYSMGEGSTFDSKLAYIGSNFTVGKVHHFQTLAGYNLFTSENNNETTSNEFGAEFNYGSTIGSVQTSIRSKYGSPNYYSTYGGRLNIVANSLWSINPNNRLLFYYVENNTNRGSVFVDRQGKIEHQYIYSPAILVFYSPAIKQYRIEGLQNFTANSYFSSTNYQMILGARFSNLARTFTVSPKVEFAFAKITNNPFNTDTRNDMLSYQYFSLNYRDRSFNILGFYTSGPRTAFDQMLYANLNRPNRKLQFMPAFDRFVYKDIVRIYAGISYTNDVVAKSSYTNITGQVYWHLPKGWRIYALGVYSLQNRTNIMEISETYQNFYIEASIRKEFDLQQPRVKFYDVDLIFFKDFNGNSVQEPNEPGIRNVLLTINRESENIYGRIPGDFNSAELLSDNLGRVRLEKIPEGRYSISYNPVGAEAGTYSKAIENAEINIDRNGNYYFPFVEKNKVFGEIVLNRSRLSGLGNIDLSNVRITVTDSHGRTYSTLTNKNGNFELFAPITDEYIVNINNIFYENFDLRQNNFLVQFNGYKQFEVNFVFDEKVRRINFATSDSDAGSGVQQVRRTTISGTVKDANSQQPVRAKVNLINTRTNTAVTSVNSSATSGEYTMSFIAGDNYLLEVVADDYWYLSENLVLEQITTFMNIGRDVLLKPVTVGSSINLNIRFDINSSFLAPESVAELNRLIRQLKENPTVRINIQGHCDNLEALNQPGIALERANVVGKYLVENGFSNFEIKSLGNTDPLSIDETEEGRAQNRRISIVVVSR